MKDLLAVPLFVVVMLAPLVIMQCCQWSAFNACVERHSPAECKELKP